MKFGFYPKLALTGMGKNKKIYLPYFFTCSSMITVFYIVCFLSSSETIHSMPAGAPLQSVLSLGIGVIGFFSCIFLFYTNSFLIRRRKKEFGLYNILGMGKRNLARILIWETLFLYAVSLLLGSFCGILFSKAAELCVTKILNQEASAVFSVSIPLLYRTAAGFGGIFFLILLNALRQIHLSNPAELLRSENVGEKPPRANWLLALAGLLTLCGAYYLALTVKNPMAAMTVFFIAVLMVIAATYLLFISGSVAFCRLLQKNRHYYYRPNHFVSVSSMVYRMKRNGAGLASICILSTMVLVMISSSSCLLIGVEDSLVKQYPQDFIVISCFDEPSLTEEAHRMAEQSFSDCGVSVTERIHYRYISVTAYLDDNRLVPDASVMTNSLTADFSNICTLTIVPLEDYTALTGDEKTLFADEALLYCSKDSWKPASVTLGDKFPMKIQEISDSFSRCCMDDSPIFSSVLLVVPDWGTLEAIADNLRESCGSSAEIHDYYGLSAVAPDSAALAVRDTFGGLIPDLRNRNQEAFWSLSYYSRAEARRDFYGLYGGLLFLASLLGAVFLAASALMMYYKQISEGYEDQSRFEILQKVGMTAREIKKSINSQVLTVFFLPLVAAGIHTAFAFPMIEKLLLGFGLTDTGLFVKVNVICYLIYALIYALIYKITARSYYKIVSTS